MERARESEDVKTGGADLHTSIEAILVSRDPCITSLLKPCEVFPGGCQWAVVWLSCRRPFCKGTTRGCCSLRDLHLSQSSTTSPPKTSNATTTIHPSFDMICCIRLVRKPVLQLSMDRLCWEIFAGNETMDFPMNDGLSAENVLFIIFES